LYFGGHGVWSVWLVERAVVAKQALVRDGTFLVETSLKWG
jgi:hypothetical protein